MLTLATLPLRRRLLAAVVVASVLAAVQAVPSAHAAGGTSVISGTIFQDLDRDGVLGAGEAPLSGEQVYLLDGAGQYLTTVVSDSAGNYSFVSLADGDYRVQYASAPWRARRMDWVPTTTGSVLPRVFVHLAGQARADFGWRPIVRSATGGAPITTYTGPQGLRVESYDDAVSAKALYDELLAGEPGAVGGEAAAVTVRFDQPVSNGQDGNTISSVQRVDGVYQAFSAVSDVTYTSWLGEDAGRATPDASALSHEYGHAWSFQRATIVQQDQSLTAYLRARGVDGDARVRSSYAWDPNEMIAEDYRQLIGPASGRDRPQMNADIAPAATVPGLRDFLLGAFSQAPTGPIQNTMVPKASMPSGGSASVSIGEWMGSMPRSRAYQWQRCDGSGAGCSAIPGATGWSYQPTGADAGFTLRATVTTSNSLGSDARTTAPTPVVGGSAAPANTALPAIGGLAQAGQTLTATVGTWTGGPTSFAYQWQRCDRKGASCLAIAGATGTAYVATRQDAGSTLRVRVTAANASGSATATSAATAAVRR